MIALLLAVVLDCKPVELSAFTARGFTKRKLSVAVTKTSVTVLEDTRPLFTDREPPFAVMIAEDDGWVAMKGPYPVGVVRIAPTVAGAKLAVVDPLEHLSPEERKRVPETSCGTSWFAGWKNTRGTLVLQVSQGDAPQLTLRVKPDGTVSR